MAKKKTKTKKKRKRISRRRKIAIGLGIGAGVAAIGTAIAFREPIGKFVKRGRKVVGGTKSGTALPTKLGPIEAEITRIGIEVRRPINAGKAFAETLFGKGPRPSARPGRIFRVPTGLTRRSGDPTRRPIRRFRDFTIEQVRRLPRPLQKLVRDTAIF